MDPMLQSFCVPAIVTNNTLPTHFMWYMVNKYRTLSYSFFFHYSIFIMLLLIHSLFCVTTPSYTAGETPKYLGLSPTYKQADSDTAPIQLETEALYNHLKALAPSPAGTTWDDDTLTDEFALIFEWMDNGSVASLSARFNAICARREQQGKWFPGKTC